MGGGRRLLMYYVGLPRLTPKFLEQEFLKRPPPKKNKAMRVWQLLLLGWLQLPPLSGEATPLQPHSTGAQTATSNWENRGLCHTGHVVQGYNPKLSQCKALPEPGFLLLFVGQTPQQRPPLPLRSCSAFSSCSVIPHQREATKRQRGIPRSERVAADPMKTNKQPPSHPPPNQSDAAGWEAESGAFLVVPGPTCLQQQKPSCTSPPSRGLGRPEPSLLRGCGIRNSTPHCCKHRQGHYTQHDRGGGRWGVAVKALKLGWNTCGSGANRGGGETMMTTHPLSHTALSSSPRAVTGVQVQRLTHTHTTQQQVVQCEETRSFPSHEGLHACPEHKAVDTEAPPCPIVCTQEQRVLHLGCTGLTPPAVSLGAGAVWSPQGQQNPTSQPWPRKGAGGSQECAACRSFPPDGTGSHKTLLRPTGPDSSPHPGRQKPPGPAPRLHLHTHLGAPLQWGEGGFGLQAKTELTAGETHKQSQDEHPHPNHTHTQVPACSFTCSQAAELEAPRRGDVRSDGAALDDRVEHLADLLLVHVPLGAHVQLHKDVTLDLPAKEGGGKEMVLIHKRRGTTTLPGTQTPVRPQPPTLRLLSCDSLSFLQCTTLLAVRAAVGKTHGGGWVGGWEEFWVGHLILFIYFQCLYAHLLPSHGGGHIHTPLSPSGPHTACLQPPLCQGVLGYKTARAGPHRELSACSGVAPHSLDEDHADHLLSGDLVVFRLQLGKGRGGIKGC